MRTVALFRDLGIRVMQFSYNKRSPFGAGVRAPDAGGLTDLGRKAAETMNNVGISIDVSHANPATTVDALAVSKKPVIMTHAGCAAIYLHPRNKTDQQLRALADKGGVLGVYDIPFLTASPKQPTVDDYIAHMEHALKVMGEDHVGVGSDALLQAFDTSPKGMAQFNKSQEQRQKSGLAAPEEDRPTYVVGPVQEGCRGWRLRNRPSGTKSIVARFDGQNTPRSLTRFPTEIRFSLKLCLIQLSQNWVTPILCSHSETTALQGVMPVTSIDTHFLLSKRLLLRKP